MSEGLSQFTKEWGGVIDGTDECNDSDLMTEIRAYIALKPLPEKKKDSFHLLHWWRDHEQDFPLLSRIAQKVIILHLFF